MDRIAGNMQERKEGCRLVHMEKEQLPWQCSHFLNFHDDRQDHWPAFCFFIQEMVQPVPYILFNA